METPSPKDALAVAAAPAVQPAEKAVASEFVRPRLQGEQVDSTFDAMAEFASAGHREIAPLYLKEQDTGLLGILGSQGLYRMGVHADGRPVLIYAEEPNDLAPAQHRDEQFRAKYAPGYYLDPARMGRVDIVAARRSRTHKKWVAEAVNRHSYSVNDSKTEFGILYRLSPRMWLSGAIAYTLEPVKKEPHPEGETVHEEQELYRVRCYTTPGRLQPFGNIGEMQLNTHLGRILSWGKNKTLVTMADAESIIREDFARRVDLVLRNRDPNLLGRIKDEPQASSRLSPLVKGMRGNLKRTITNGFVRFVQAAGEQIKTLRAQALVLGVGRTALLSLIQFLFKGWRATIGQIILGTLAPVMNSLKRAQALMTNSRLEDIGYSFWKPGRTPSGSGNSLYNRIDPKQAPLIRLLGYDEARIRPLEGTSLRTTLRTDWAEEYILDTLDTPWGSIATRRHIGGGDVLQLAEPGGMDVYYLIGKNIAYAVAPDPKGVYPGHLSESVAKLMAEKGPIIRVWSDDENILRSENVPQAQFEARLSSDMEKAPIVSAIPPLAYDMSLLKEFAKRAELEQRNSTGMRRVLKSTFNVATRTGEILRLRPKRVETVDLSQTQIAAKLADCGPLPPKKTF